MTKCGKPNGDLSINGINSLPIEAIAVIGPLQLGSRDKTSSQKSL